MKNEINVPSMGESISEVVIGQILVPSGTSIKADAEMIELETDKVNQILYAPQPGEVEWRVKTGDVVKIGQVIGTIDSAASAVLKTKVEEKVPETHFQAKEGAMRFTKEDFLSELRSPSKEPSPRKEEKSALSHEVKTEEREARRPMSHIRKVIAQRLVEAQQATAMLTTFNEVDMTQVIQLREKYKDLFLKRHGSKLGFMSFFVKSVVAALQAYPALNSYIDGDEIVHREYYDIGVAVGTDKGVIVPVVRDCDRLTCAEIEQAIEGFAKKAREGSLAIADLQGGGFTITNGGVYGSLLSTPILTPPQCAILGMHKIEKRPVVINDQITIRSMMYLALSYDHRLIDGKEAVSFLVHIKNLLEDPSRFLLDV